MSWGRSNRLSRIFDPASGRTNMLAVDRGDFLGPITGMEAPQTVVAPLLPYADALGLYERLAGRPVPAGR